MTHRRAAPKAAAVAAVVVVCLVVNAFLFNSWSVDDYSYDPSEISRRLDNGDGPQQRTIRDRIIDSLKERRGVSPGDPDFQRLYLARLNDLQKQSEIPTSRRVALRTLASKKNIWMRSNKQLENELLEAQKSNVNNNEGVLDNVEPLSVCGRPTSVGTQKDLALLEHNNAGADQTCPGANSNKLLLLQRNKTYGKTGNNLIEM